MKSLSLRTRILLIVAPLVVLILAIGIAGTLLLVQLGRQSDAILRENYDSVQAMSRLNEAAERIDSSFQFALAGQNATLQSSPTSHGSSRSCRHCRSDINRKAKTFSGKLLEVRSAATTISNRTVCSARFARSKGRHARFMTSTSDRCRSPVSRPAKPHVFPRSVCWQG
jgi:hypothetical protein